MKKIILSLSIFIFLTIAVKKVGAIPLLTTKLPTLGTTRTLTLPPAADNSPVISLGTAFDPGSGQIVEGYAFIRYKDNFIKPNGASANKPRGSACYTYLASGAKWKNVEDWIVNTDNSDGLSSTTVSNILSNGINKWEDATDGIISNGIEFNILGNGSITPNDLSADTTAPDTQNEVYFADITDDVNIIAVTIVWGIFGGPPQTRKLVEWDQVYDDVTFDWSAETAGVPGKMDFDNIATHELGHSVGMGDLYNSCIAETMYGYAETGEIIKRDLNSGDILGIDKLY